VAVVTYQLTQATHPNMPIEQFSYDAVGNRQTSEGQAPSLGRSTDYVYDFENRLTEVDYFGTLAQYKYDPFGRRIEKNVNGAITRYLYDGPNIVTEYDGTWNVMAKYTHTLDIDDPLTVEQAGNAYYYHKDGLGSVVNLTDSAGNTVKGYTYKSFGEIYSETGTLNQPFTFTGREYDPESGLYYFRARYYDPRAGRFLTKDPIGLAGGDVNLYRYVDSVGKPILDINPYRYANNNPINYTDPMGLYVWPYTWKGWAAVTLGLAGISIARAGNIAVGGAFIGGAVALFLWEAYEAPIEAERDAKERLKKAMERMKELEELLKELNETPKNKCP